MDDCSGRGLFDGDGDLTVYQIEDDLCAVSLRWRTNINHPQIRYLVRFFHPILRMSHRWAVNSVKRVMQGEINRHREGRLEIQPENPTFGPILGFLNGLNYRPTKLIGWRRFDEH